jgi:hypothetical protein
MPRKDRNYRGLFTDTIHIYDALDEVATQLKDYSSQHNIEVKWRQDKEQIHRRLVHIDIDDAKFIGRATHISDAVNDLMEDTLQDGIMPRDKVEVEGVWEPLVIDLTTVNQECLRDHVAEVSIGDTMALIDLEELLKATRYA